MLTKERGLCFSTEGTTEFSSLPDHCASAGRLTYHRSSRRAHDQRRTAAATRSAASSRGCRRTARPGSDVSTTQMVSLAGSAQQSVPVEPVWPKVRSEQPGLPDSLPTPNPNPRGVNPAGLWFLIISRAVSGLMTLPRAPMNSLRNRATSGAEACVPPQGAPSFRQ